MTPRPACASLPSNVRVGRVRSAGMVLTSQNAPLFLMYTPARDRYPVLKLRKEEKPPRAPKSGFVVFLSENALKWKAELTESLGRTVKGPDFARKASELWKAMSDEEKKPYVAAALADKERYRKEMDEWFRKSDPRIIRACSIQGRRLAPKPADIKLPCPPFTE
ncbi:hypothetical protein NUW54_g14595 [Trametes sanguinea]|uniref:Uncharacterized protein n=1 Tax=Trametes sanguinea TaxID=158606 RepID=A0ACC1MDI4_9APHY|nr:hypothetical protein NUW54_g14595 [Trametes sanguinea]